MPGFSNRNSDGTCMILIYETSHSPMNVKMESEMKVKMESKSTSTWE